MFRVTGLVLVLLASSVSAEPGGATRPKHNNSFVPDDDEALRELVLSARQAASSGDPAMAAGKLQALMSHDLGQVVSWRGRELFVSPRRWAALSLLGNREPFGKEVLQAWRRLYDPEANGAIHAAMVSGDETTVLSLIDRFPAATVAPHALMMLSDRAFLRGDREHAILYLDRVPEHLATDERSLVESDSYKNRRRHLHALPPAKVIGWPTLGGAPDRARNGSPLPPPGELQPLWTSRVLEKEPWRFTNLERHRRPRRQSLVLPMQPVCDATQIYLNLGTHLRVFERKTGKLVDVVPDQDDPDIPTADLAMSDIGWLLDHSPGARAVTVHKGLVHFARLPRAALPSRMEAKLRNELVAYDVEKRAIVWRIGGGTDTDTVLKRGVFFRGAPAVAGSRLFVFGAARVKSEDGEFTRKEEGYLFCFDRRTGELLWRRLLAYGDTESPPTFPPQAGVAPAYSRGVVTVVTGLGVAAAVDERDGEILWLLRHSRMRFRERQRLSRNRPDRSLRHRSAWFREAPRIVGDSVYFAPFDGEELHACWLRGKLIDGDFFVVRWEKSRKKDHFNCLLEQVAGIHGGRIFSIGRPDDRNPRLYESVVSVPLDLGRGLAYGRLPAIVRDRRSGLALPPELFGRACIAGDVLLVPTETRLYRFDLSAIHAKAAGAAAETVHEIASLKPYEGLAESRSSFGNLIAVDGILYAATVTELIAYGPASAKPDPPEEGPPEGPPPQDGPEEEATGNDPE